MLNDLIHPRFILEDWLISEGLLDPRVRGECGQVRRQALAQNRQEKGEEGLGNSRHGYCKGKRQRPRCLCTATGRTKAGSGHGACTSRATRPMPSLEHAMSGTASWRTLTRLLPTRSMIEVTTPARILTAPLLRANACGACAGMRPSLPALQPLMSDPLGGAAISNDDLVEEATKVRDRELMQLLGLQQRGVDAISSSGGPAAAPAQAAAGGVGAARAGQAGGAGASGRRPDGGVRRHEGAQPKAAFEQEQDTEDEEDFRR